MNLNRLDNQVSGHEGVLATGEENEIVVKPARLQEIEFYEECVRHPEFQAWMPTYYGTLTLTAQQGQEESHQLPQPPVDQDGSSTSVVIGSAISPPLYQSNGQGKVPVQVDDGQGNQVCICLENLSHGFFKPCILDLKLGVQLYDEDASEAKKARLTELAASSTSGPLGIRLTGFRVYDSEAGDFVVYSKEYGKKLPVDQVLDGFRNYFSAKLGPKKMHLVIERFVNDLTDFLATMETQEVSMRASSLLFVYEGDPDAFDQALLVEQDKITEAAKGKSHRDSNGQNDGTAGSENGQDSDDEEEDMQKITDLRVIDFGRSKWTPGQGPDEDIMFGIKNTLSLLKKLLDQDYPEEDE
ncbi:hypothetical protein B0O80DRAFT_444253 [Mortierella sp. GBAus27b]|nr:hypothetical protein BGX31_007616 [Mortierella sp. GBA43]KAI8358215.1 hypothetical protein B0O80DRAFT_444253 [Mortierella sp. GBAus27b]